MLADTDSPNAGVTTAGGKQTSGKDTSGAKPGGASHRRSATVRLRDRVFWRMLFPEAPPGRISAKGVALGVLAVLVGAAVSLWRNTGASPLDTTVMEDAKFFLADQIDHGFWASLVTPYSGYFHAVPRLIAWPAALVRPDQAAAVMAIGAALVTSLLAVFVYFASAGHFSSKVQRVLVSAPILLMPVAQIEIFNEINMLRWPLMYATFWAALWVPGTRAGRIVDAAVLVTAALSDNIVGIFLPLLALRLWVRYRGSREERRGWDRSAAVGAIALVLGTLASFAVVVSGVSTRGVTPRIDPLWALSAYIVRPVPAMMVGTHWLGYDPPHTLVGALPVVAGWLVIAAVATVAVRRLTSPAWLLAGVAGLFSLLIYLYTITVVGVAGPRYSAPAGLLILTAVVALLTPRVDRPRGSARAALVAFTVLFAIVCATNLRSESWRTEGPLWSDELSAARVVCVQTHADQVELRVSPMTVGWTATLPCSYVLR